MKNYLNHFFFLAFLLALVTIWQSDKAAASAPTTAQKDYTLVYRLADDEYTVTTKAESFESAIDFAAEKCFDHFAQTKGKVPEEKGRAIIDICINPRTI